ncbi:DUF4345 domain-containing protein [Saccharothrix hoggarensis]|uniref:DUF4345 domain-containing protein n=1 Tax=Saccharothrix hoggarensis TaxID=913853 RepID=A0ABW3QQL6_9PSEU
MTRTSRPTTGVRRNAHVGRGVRVKAFQAVVVVLGVFMVGTGLAEVAIGPSLLPGTPAAAPTLDSNYRFFAAMWLAMGVAMLSVARRVRESTTVLRFVCAAVFVGGLARVVSWVAEGTPHPMMLVLLAIEFTVPPVLVLWQRRWAA